VVNHARRGVLSPLFNKKEPKPIRPPYVVDWEFFHQVCPNCEEKSCGIVCEEAIIFIDAQGSPQLDFKNAGCTFCKACAIACPHGVLSLDGEAKIEAKISIDTAKCLAWNGTMCFTCKDMCEPNAIKFFGLYRPVINDDCTACGLCKSPCPVDAITIGGGRDVL
jgi:ferredoxin-type protein NapF